MGSRNNKPGRIVKGTAPQPSLKSASGVWSLDEAMQAHRANAWPQPNLFQPVANSLRLKKNSGTLPFMAKTPARPGNLLKWTVSAWVKLGAIGTASRMELFSAGDTAAAATPANMSLMINWQGYSQDWHIAFLTGGGSYQIQTNMVLRDPSAWYHVVVVYDAAQSTNTNRVQIYINGVLASWSSTAPTGGAAAYTPQNLPLNWNNAGQIQRIGSGYDGGETYFLDGNIAEFYNIDGHALPPTLFGQYDTNNTWVPIAYTGSYGTNGFYLPFTNARSSQTLGFDASLTGTTTYDADQDPYRGSVALHLTGNGPAGGSNNTFADSSTNNLAITRGGTATQGGFSPFPFNTTAPYNPATHGASAYFNGSSDYLSIASVPAIGTQDFTVECWVYANSTVVTGGSNPRVFDVGGAQLVIEDTGKICRLDLNDSTSLYVSSSNVFQLNRWTHIAVVRISNAISFYLNGVAQIATSSSLNLTGGTGYVGVYRGGTVGFWNGYISGLRLTIGKGIYTAAFTPTNRPFGTLTNNLIPASEDFANTGFWAQSNVSVTPSFAVAPDGTPSATKLILTSGSLQKRLNFTSYTPGAGTYTFSVYAKAADYNYLVVTIYESSYKGAVFNLATGVIESTLASTTTSMTSVGNGWYRISVTATTGGTLNNNATGLWPYQTLPGSAGGNATSDGNSSGGVYIWGAQFESASSPSNYVPTPANYSTAPSLLLNFANAAVVDSAGAGNIVTASNATITSSAKYGSGALAFNGSSDYFQSSWSLNSFLSPGANNWTLETWVYMTKSLSSVQVIVNYGYESGSTRSFVWYYNGDGTFRLAQSPDGSTNYDAGFGAPQGGFQLNTWYHLAIVRNFGAMTMYVNGKAMPNTLSAYTISSINTGVFRVGVDGSNYFGGSMDDVRLTKGVARYTTDFTPPARALPETGGKSFVTTNVNAGVVQRFTTTGTTSWTAPVDVTSVEILVVAGGGGGGAYISGGGGAGGLIYNNQYPVTPGQTYTVTVGAGGAGGTGSGQGTTGSNSQFGGLLAFGGGCGQGGESGPYTTANGGSGGGQGRTPGGRGGTQGTGVAGQGFGGGAGVNADGSGSTSGGGGGGSGAVGGAGSGATPGNGGAGLQFGISGTPQFYAGGGGGGAFGGSNSSGGSSVGGNGSGGLGTAATNPTANTGSGGGAGGYPGQNDGTAGATGIVVVRYTTTAVGNTSDATTDNLVDSPTLYGHDTGAGGEVVGNYVTWNPLDRSPTAVLSNGNLDITPGFSTQTITRATMSIPLGQWYFEVTCRSTGGDASAGEIGFNTAAARAIDGGYLTWAANSIYYNGTNGNKTIFGTVTSYGASWTTNDIIGVAIDTVAGTIVFYKNGASQGTITDARIISNTLFPVFANNSTSGSRNVSANFGQRAWAYAPPVGYNALTTKNLPRLAIGSAAATPNQYFDVATWTQGATDVTLTNAGGFQPDFVWIKSRSNSQNHYLMDSVRGTTGLLRSNGTGAESTGSTWITFNSNGFTPSSTNTVTNTYTYVGWQWKAGGTAVANTSGTITSQVSANTTSGFSIVTYTGTGSAATIGHGLGVTPSMITVKQRNGVNNWPTWHTSLTGGNGYYVYWDSVNGTGTSSTVFNGTNPTSSVFSVGTNSLTNGSTSTYVAYCWAEIAGFSKFGTYTGTGAADGPFVYLGFTPRFVMVKKTDSSDQDWYIWDSARSSSGGNNALDLKLYPNQTFAENGGAGGGESTSTNNIDAVSNGFKLRTGNAASNASSGVYIYMAFAAKPFGNVNGTAR